MYLEAGEVVGPKTWARKKKGGGGRKKRKRFIYLKFMHAGREGRGGLTCAGGEPRRREKDETSRNRVCLHEAVL